MKYASLYFAYIETCFVYILKRKSFKTHNIKMQLFYPNISLDDNVTDNSRDLPSLQHENRNGEKYGCRASTRKVRQPLI